MTRPHDASHLDAPPREWAVLLSVEDWRTAVRAVGRERLEELRSLMAELSPRFRRTVVREMAALDDWPPGQRAIVAIARGVHGLSPDVRGCGPDRRADGRTGDERPR